MRKISRYFKFVFLFQLVIANMALTSSATPISLTMQNIVHGIENGRGYTCLFQEHSFRAGKVKRNKFYSYVKLINNLKKRRKRTSNIEQLENKITSLKMQRRIDQRLCRDLFNRQEPPLVTPTPIPLPSQIPTPIPTPNLIPLSKLTRPLTESDIRYLYEKVALGAVPAEAITIGLNNGIDNLIEYITTPSESFNNQDEALSYLNYGNINEAYTHIGISLWALKILASSTQNAFFDRFAFIFLHNMIPTSSSTLGTETLKFMIPHVDKLRSTAISGNYPELVRSMVNDGAMLYWLSGVANTKYVPNENFARELMELFTLGTKNLQIVNSELLIGSRAYSEDTVAQIARACTGWQVLPNPTTAEFEVIYFLPYHDSSPTKLIFEDTIFSKNIENCFDVIDHIYAAHPNAARYLALRLAKEYLNEKPPIDVVDSLASILRYNNYNLLEAMRYLLKSEIFFASENRDSIVKTPVEKVLQLIKATGIPYDHVLALKNISRSGMEITKPPTVFGWSSGDFRSQDSILEVSNAIARILRLDFYYESAQTFDYATLLPENPQDPANVISHLAKILNVTLTSSEQDKLISYMNSKRNSNGTIVAQSWDPTNPTIVRTKVPGLIQILTTHVSYLLR